MGKDFVGNLCKMDRRIEKIFRKLGVNKSGGVSKDEMDAYLERKLKVCPGATRRKIVRESAKVFKEEAGEDELLNPFEFKRFYTKQAKLLIECDQVVRGAEAMFNAMDTDRSGVVTTDEIRAFGETKLNKCSRK